MEIAKVKEILLPYLEKNNLILFDIEFVKEDGNLFLRVYIDKNGGIDVDTLALVNNFLSNELDKIDDDMPEYFLEVSSPGIERELKGIDDIKNNIGNYIHIELENMIYEGFLIDVNDDTLIIKINIKGRIKNINVLLNEIKFIRLAVKF